MYTLDAYVADLRRITAATTDYGEIFDQVAPLAPMSTPSGPI